MRWPKLDSTNKTKDQLTLRLDKIHLKLIDELKPFYGNSRPEVIRSLVIDWFKKEYGLERLKEKGAIK